jgi:hypothetical protein
MKIILEISDVEYSDLKYASENEEPRDIPSPTMFAIRARIINEIEKERAK